MLGVYVGLALVGLRLAPRSGGAHHQRCCGQLLGGFFPPLLLGLIRQVTGSFVVGFLALAVFAAGCGLVAHMIRPQPAIPAPTAGR